MHRIPERARFLFSIRCDVPKLFYFITESRVNITDILTFSKISFFTSAAQIFMTKNFTSLLDLEINNRPNFNQNWEYLKREPFGGLNFRNICQYMNEIGQFKIISVMTPFF